MDSSDIIFCCLSQVGDGEPVTLADVLVRQAKHGVIAGSGRDLLPLIERWDAVRGQVAGDAGVHRLPAHDIAIFDTAGHIRAVHIQRL